MFLTIITFAIILGILVLVHELGHFFAARWNGVRVDEFGLGLPPRMLGVHRTSEGFRIVWGKKLKAEDSEHTIYSLNWIPLGGFVKIKGEDGGNEDEDSFVSKKIWQRVVMLVSGVSMNIVLAILLLSTVFMLGVPTVVSRDVVDTGRVENVKVQVMEVLPNSPAELAGIKIGDVILGAQGAVFSNIDSLRSFLSDKAGSDIVLRIESGGERSEVVVAPHLLEETGETGIGVGLVQTGIVHYPWYQAFWEGAKETGYLLKEIFRAIGTAISSIWTDQPSPIDVAGPVGIAVMTGQVVGLGFVYILQFAALLSINLAIINILPFPALDGGRILFLVIEKVKGSPVDRRIEGWIHNVGFALLLLLILGITMKDIFGLFIE